MSFLMLSWLASPLLIEAQHSVARRLDAKEKQLERVYAEYWRAEYQIALGDEQASSRPAEETIRAVVTDDAFIKSLQAAHNRLLRRRRELFLDEATYTKISNNPNLTREQRFGNCCSKKAGKFLKTNFYSQGAELSLDALMRNWTGESLSERHLIASLRDPGATQTIY
jgi:hypothetical protein